MKNYTEALEMLLAKGFLEGTVCSSLETCCKTGTNVRLSAGRTTYQIDVIYNGGKREDTDYWGHDISEYLFDIRSVRI